jgi:hypothetical protein
MIFVCRMTFFLMMVLTGDGVGDGAGEAEVATAGRRVSALGLARLPM